VAAHIDPVCEGVLSNYDFPGNIRELRHGLERALLMSNHGEIAIDCLPSAWLVRRSPKRGAMATLDDVEKNYIAEVLKQTRGKKSKAAQILGISRKTLLEKRKKYGLE